MKAEHTTENYRKLARHVLQFLSDEEVEAYVVEAIMGEYFNEPWRFDEDAELNDEIWEEHEREQD